MKTRKGMGLISGIFRLVDGSLAQQHRFENISTNLANVNTNGFKKSVISFDKALSLNNQSSIDFSRGAVVHTGNKLDMALDGNGFFKIATPDGTRYTRDGAFTLDADGTLITSQGYQVLGENGPITVSGGDIVVQQDGEVSDANGSAGRLSIVDFDNPESLRKIGGPLYLHIGENNNITSAREFTLQQGYLEKSNVNPSEEMIKMIEAYRNFESVQKAIQSMDEITSKLVNDSELI